MAVRRFATLTLLASLAACSTLVVIPPPIQPPVPKLTSKAEADAMLADASVRRAAIETRFKTIEAACYERFLVNDCLDHAKEERRQALAPVRVNEVEAARYQRQAANEEHAEAVKLALQAAAEEEQRRAALPPKVEPPPAPPKPALRIAVDYEARAALRQKQIEQKQAAGATQRAANVVAYELKQQRSEQRQRELAERKAAKAAKAAAASAPASQP